ncbi:MAG: T9SS type A sorting domain-containing protein [Bacteroidales bacterium]|nr:T9SS type A sorting domain-containing protein [Bacteroidales bacterium]
MKLKTAILSLLIFCSLLSKTYSQHTHAEWSKHITANEQTAFNNVLFDGESVISNGYWYLGAEYEGVTLPYHTSSNALIVKSDLNGNKIWHATMVGEGYETFFDMALDSENNVVAVGWSSSNDTIRINGEVVYVPDMEWTSRGIVAKFSGIDGSLIWYKPILPFEEYYNMSITRVTIDAADNIYISGYSNTSFAIDGIEFLYTQNGWGTQTFIAKLDAQGAAVWGSNFNFISSGDPGWSNSRALVTKNDELFLAIEYSKPLIVGDSILPYQGEGFYDWIAIVKLSADGAIFSDVIAYGSEMNQNLTRLKLDHNGNVVVAGFFESESDFNIQGIQPMSYGVEDAYVAKFTNNLELIWVKSMGSEFATRAFNLNIDADNRNFVGGGFDSYTPFYFEGHKVIEAESPNSLGMFQVIINEDGEFEKAFALHGGGIESRVEYRDAVVLQNDQIYAVGASVEDVEFIEGNTFSSIHDAGFFMKWDLSKTYYKAEFEVKDVDGNLIGNAVITLGNNTNAANNYSFFQLEPGIYNYSVTLNGFNTVQGNVEITDQNETVAVTMISGAVSVPGISMSSVSLFPNPSSSTVSLIMGSDIQEVTITDTSGRIMYKRQVGANSIQIDISDFPGGFYLIHLTSQNETTVRKMFVKK